MSDKRGPRTTDWVFTLNFTGERPEIDWASKDVVFAVWQHERVSHDHLQGFVVFARRKRLSELRKLIQGAHWEARKGSRQDAQNYCCKEESRIAGPFHFGELPDQLGDRTSGPSATERLIQGIRDGLDDRQLLELEPRAAFSRLRQIREWRLVLRPGRTAIPRIIVIWGETGSGKTRGAIELAETSGLGEIYWKDNSGHWFDGYTGQKIIIIDDFYGAIPCGFMLRLLDRYPMLLPIKGAYVPLMAELIIVTSNKPPEEWYKFEDWAEHRPALLRRLNEVHHKTLINPTDYSLSA